jgi:hypothetical protein
VAAVACGAGRDGGLIRVLSKDPSGQRCARLAGPAVVGELWGAGHVAGELALAMACFLGA